MVTRNRNGIRSFNPNEREPPIPEKEHVEKLNAILKKIEDLKAPECPQIPGPAPGTLLAAKRAMADNAKHEDQRVSKFSKWAYEKIFELTNYEPGWKITFDTQTNYAYSQFICFVVSPYGERMGRDMEMKTEKDEMRYIVESLWEELVDGKTRRPFGL